MAFKLVACRYAVARIIRRMYRREIMWDCLSNLESNVPILSIIFSIGLIWSRTLSRSNHLNRIGYFQTPAARHICTNLGTSFRLLWLAIPLSTWHNHARSCCVWNDPSYGIDTFKQLVHWSLREECVAEHSLLKVECERKLASGHCPANRQWQVPFH